MDVGYFWIVLFLFSSNFDDYILFFFINSTLKNEHFRNEILNLDFQNTLIRYLNR